MKRTLIIIGWIILCLFALTIIPSDSRKTSDEVIGKEKVYPVYEPISIKPIAKVKASPLPVKQIQPTVKPVGNKDTWLRASGIPESLWFYVDYIVSRESGWNPTARNSSSGACGLVQQYPCGKIAGDWRDPVAALKWQYNYVTARYGGYPQAYNYWLANHNY